MIFADHKVELLNTGRLQELTGYVNRNRLPIIMRNETAYPH